MKRKSRERRGSEPSISTPGCSKLDLRTLERVARRPKLFEQATNSFWTDPYIASHVLNAHLDPLTDAASRQPHIIARSSRWIREQSHRLSPTTDDHENRTLRLLDLGCGPGLYSTEFARLGFQVTGVDFSEHSLAYARREAGRERLSINYEYQDYRTIEYRGEYEVATLIYGEFGVFSDDDRDLVLDRVRNALVPGGLFFFDVFTERYAERVALSDGWYVATRDGFWSSEPHLVLESTHRYTEEHVNVDRYVIVGDDGTIRTYNNWKHYYDRDAVTSVLERCGFRVESIWNDLCGEPYTADSEWIGIIARPR